MPWAVLFVSLMLIFIIEAAQGQFGLYGDMSPVFRTAGLHPRDASIFFWAVTGVGLFLTFISLFADILRALWQKWAAPACERLVTRYPFLRFSPELIGLTILFTIAVVVTFTNPADHTPTSPVVKNITAGPIYEHALFQVPHRNNFKPITGVETPPSEILMRTIHGKAIVTKIGPETYQIRMLH
jgi:hypothetical protein